MQAIIKQPGEALNIPVTFGVAVTSIASVVQSARGLVSGAAVLSIGQQLADGQVTLAIGGGTVDERYLVTVTADDAVGQRLQAEIEVAVLDLAWTMPDGGAPMLTVAQFVGRVGIDEAVRMTDARGDGRIGRDLLVNALIDAQALVEAHIGARYALPINPVPILLQSIIADLARARLYPNGAPDGISTAARAAQRTLERIQSGDTSLPAAAPAAVPSEAPILIATGERAYPDNLRGY